MKNSTKKELQDQLVIKSEVTKKQLKQIEELQSLIKTLTDEKKCLTDEVNMRKTNAVTREEHDEIVATKDTIISALNSKVTSLNDTLTSTNKELNDTKHRLVNKYAELESLKCDNLHLEAEVTRLTTVNRIILFVTAMTAVIAVVTGCLVD